MTSLDFLYIALGGGFVILVIFLCVLFLNLTLVLRDVSKMTANFKEVSERVREVVMEPMKALSEMTASLGFIHQIVEKIRTRFEEVKEDAVCKDCGEEECYCEPSEKEKEEAKKALEKEKEKEQAKKKGFFSIRKLGK